MVNKTVPIHNGIALQFVDDGAIGGRASEATFTVPCTRLCVRERARVRPNEDEDDGDGDVGVSQVVVLSEVASSQHSFVL